MFTPQRRRPPPTATPGSEPRVTTIPGASSHVDKGKAVAISPPPLLLVPSLGGREDVGGMEDWWRFKEAGLLDKAAMERKHREALLERASRLEKALYDYQHNMGLLLLEKEEWNLKFEGINEALVEAQEILKREHSKNVNELSDAEERLDSLRKAISAERQCVYDLERAWHDLQEEREQVKQTSDARLAEAKTLATRIEKKPLEVEEKLCSAEARLLEVNSKSLELDMKLQELEARESLLQKERLSLLTEREALEATLIPQRRELNEWESRLRRGEEMLSELRKSFNKREEAADENDRILNQKARDLDETQRNIDLFFSKLKEREAEVDNQLVDLIAKEKNADSRQRILDAKQNELRALEERINAREQVGVQKLLDEQTGFLEVKLQEFELGLEENRRKLAEEAKSKFDSLKREETEIFHREEKLRRQQEVLDKRLEKVKEKEQDLDAKLKYLDEIENSIKTKQGELEHERLQLLADKESLLVLGSESGKIKAEIAQQEKQIATVKEELQLFGNDRSEYNRLQSHVKQELVRYRCQEESILREAEDLREERKKFEKEWGVMEEKRAQIRKGLEDVAGLREDLEKMRNAIDGLEEENHATQDFIKRELEALEVERELSKARMRQEEAGLSEGAKREHEEMDKEFESQKNNLKSNMIHRHEEMEKALREREKAFMEKQKDISHITRIKETCQWELEEIRSEMTAVEMKRVEVVKDMKRLDEQRAGMWKDIAELDHLRKKLQGQREQNVKDRDHFLTFVEKLKTCNNCGDQTREFVFSDLQPPDVEDIEDISLVKPLNFLGNRRSDIDAHHSTNAMRSPDKVLVDSLSQERTSWLHGCTSKILRMSPIKMVDYDQAPTLAEKLSTSPVPVNMEGDGGGPGSVHVSQEAKESGIPGAEQPTLLDKVDHSIEAQPVQSDSFHLQGGGYSGSIGGHSYVNSGLQNADDSVQSEPKGLAKRGRRRKGGFGRTRSVKAVIEDAKLLHGENLEQSEQTESMQLSDTRNVSQGSQHVERSANKVAGKRSHGPIDNEQDDSDSQGQAESVTTSDCKKTKQILSSDLPTPGQQRYNLRRTKRSYVEYE